MRELGPQEIKGSAAPIETWQVMQVRSMQNKDESADLRAVAPLIGRYEELELMRDHWRTCSVKHRRCKCRKVPVPMSTTVFELSIFPVYRTARVHDWVG